MSVGITLLLTATSLTTGVASSAAKSASAFSTCGKLNTVVSYSYWNGPEDTASSTSSSTEVIDYGDKNETCLQKGYCPTDDIFDQEAYNYRLKGNDVYSGANKIFDADDLINQRYQCSFTHACLVLHDSLHCLTRNIRNRQDIDYYYFSIPSDSRVQIDVDGRDGNNLDFSLLSIDYDWEFEQIKPVNGEAYCVPSTGLAYKEDNERTYFICNSNDVISDSFDKNIYYENYYYSNEDHCYYYYDKESTWSDNIRMKHLSTVNGIKAVDNDFSFDGTLKAGTYYLKFKNKKFDSRLIQTYSFSIKVDQLDFVQDKSIKNLRYNYGYGGALWQADYSPAGFVPSVYKEKNKYDSIPKYIYKHNAEKTSANTGGWWEKNPDYVDPESDSDIYNADDAIQNVVSDFSKDITYETSDDRSSDNNIKDFYLDSLINDGVNHPSTVLYVWDDALAKQMSNYMFAMQEIFSTLLSKSDNVKMWIEKQFLAIAKGEASVSKEQEIFSVLDDAYSIYGISKDVSDIVDEIKTALKLTAAASATNPYTLPISVIALVLDVAFFVVGKIIDEKSEEYRNQTLDELYERYEKENGRYSILQMCYHYFSKVTTLLKFKADNTVSSAVIAIPLTSYMVTRDSDGNSKVEFHYPGVGSYNSEFIDVEYKNEVISSSEIYSMINKGSIGCNVPGKTYAITCSGNGYKTKEDNIDGSETIVKKCSTLLELNDSHSIDLLSGDYQWFRFKAPKDGEYAFVATTEYDQTADRNCPVIEPFDKIVYGYTADGMKCKENDLVSGSYDTKHRNYAFYDIYLKKGQFIYLRVHGKIDSSGYYGQLSNVSFHAGYLEEILETEAYRNFLIGKHVCTLCKVGDAISAELHKLFCWKSGCTSESSEYHHLTIKTTTYIDMPRMIVQKTCSDCGYYERIEI